MKIQINLYVRETVLICTYAPTDDLTIRKYQRELL